MVVILEPFAKMYRSLLVFAALLAVVYSQTAVSQCTRSPGELPLSATIAGCATPPCALPQLQDAIIDIDFIAPHNMTTMTTLATAYLSIIAIPYDLAENAATCDFLQDAACPVVQGQRLKYQLRMYIESFFPVGVAPTIEFRVVDGNMQPVICLRVPIRIVAPVARVAN